MESLDKKTIVLAWSFRDSLAEIPYRISVQTISNAKSKKNIWKCTCPAFVYRRHIQCKHITALLTETKHGKLPSNRFNVTELGMKFLKINE